MGQQTIDFGAERSAGFDAEAIVSDLNPPQLQAVLANSGPVLILAGAGSGKTRALTRKIARLVGAEGYAPWEILAVTFTNKAAGEMRERCAELLGEKAADLWLGTFHSIGVRMLRRHGELLNIPRGFVIYDQADQLAMIGRCMKAMDLSEKVFSPKRFQSYINTAKQHCQGPDHYDLPQKGPFEERALRLYAMYTKQMRSAGAVDFSDLIYLPWVLVTEHPAVAFEYQSRWRYVLVDEFQDTNRAQYKLLRAVLNPEHHICVVGDDDQSIYRWRGADVENILGFDKDFPDATVVRLEQNYRSSGNILNVAGALIARNRTRHTKRLWTDRDAGHPVKVYMAQSERDEAEYVCRRIESLRSEHVFGEMAIFYRTNAQSRAFEERLRARGISYRVIGGLKFYDRAEIKDVVAYLKLLSNPADPIALERIINRPARGIGKTTVDKIQLYAAEHGVTPWEAVCELARGGAKAMQKKLTPFVSLIAELGAVARASTALETMEAVLDKTGYLALLEQDGSIEAETRADNVKELVAAISDFSSRAEDKSLVAFLEEVALLSDIDRADLDDDDAVVMMTAHTAKGLEYDVVFLTGLEEDLLPHFNSSDSQAGVEEERRLAYVAMTRARHHLHLCHAASRRRFGQVKVTMPSRFLDGLPSESLLLEADSYRRGRRLGDDLYVSGGGWGGASRSHTSTDPYAQAAPDYEDYSQVPEDEVGRGSLVFHPKFGEGRIIEISGKGERAKASVAFADGSTRKLIMKVLTPI